MMIRFAHPVVLALLVLVLGWLRYALKRKPLSLTHSMTSKMAELAGSGRRLWQETPLILRTSCLLLLVLAAARPQLFHLSGEMRSPGVDIILCLDTSGSMEALDFRLEAKPVTRLTAVKKVVRDFINKREMDRVGLVVFGDQAFTLSPLTMDKGLLMELLDKMEIGMAGPCTAIGSALAIGGTRLKDLKAKSKILILLTDGRHNAGGITPEQAAAANQALGIKIYTIGVGGKGPAPFEKKTFFGTELVYRREDLDEVTLERVAAIAGGKYFRAADSEQLAEIYDMIDREEKTETKVEEFFHFHELYHYFLIPALLLFGLDIFLRSTILRTLP